MNVTARKLLLAFIASVGIASAATTFEVKNASINVPKNDGKLTRYQLLPVHYHPEHAAIVNARLKFASRQNAAVPANYQIPGTTLPPVRDQGQRGTCAYFATVGAIEASYIRQDASVQDTIKVSEECLVDLRNWEVDQGTAYTGDDKPDQRPDPNGDLPQSIIKTVTRYGIPSAKAYSNGVSCVYDGMNQTGNDVTDQQYLETFAEGSTAYAKGAKFDLNMAPTLDSVKALLSKNIPVEIGVVVYNDFMAGSSDWRFNPATDTQDNIAGGHAILLTGYTTDSSGKTVFTFKNSWGTDWGQSGYGTMDEGVVKNGWAFDPSFDFTLAL